MSGIPSSTGLSPGTTKNLQLAILSLCLSLTVQMPNCSMFDSLYVSVLLYCFCGAQGIYCCLKEQGSKDFE